MDEVANAAISQDGVSGFFMYKSIMLTMHEYLTKG